MTKQFDRLQEEPQTNIKRGDLNLEERSVVRSITVSGTPGRSKADATGKFVAVYYIEGDEQRAAARFVEENTRAIEQVDFSNNRNVLQSNVDREIYDWILHALGKRCLQKYETVVLEERPDGNIWIIDRQRFEEAVDRRYAINESGTARLTADSIESLYERLGDVITESDLREAGVEGDVRQVLDLYRLDSRFACDPITVENELAVRKRE